MTYRQSEMYNRENTSKTYHYSLGEKDCSGKFLRYFARLYT